MEVSLTFLRSFNRSWSVNITTILLQAILRLMKPKNWLPGNITGPRYVKILKPTSKAAMFAWLPKLSGTSHTEIYRLCQSQLTGGKIYPWILWRDCQYQLIGKAKAMTWYSSSLIGSQRWYITNQWRSRSTPRVSQKSSLMLWYGIMAYLIPLSLIGALYSRWNSGLCCAISWKSKEDSLRLSILRPMAKQRDKTAQWRHTSEPLWTGSRMTGHACCQWLSSYTIMPKMPALATHLLNSTAASIHEFLLKTTSTLAPDLALPTNWQKS